MESNSKSSNTSIQGIAHTALTIAIGALVYVSVKRMLFDKYEEKSSACGCGH